ncbi:MAG: hypothetical protein CSA50_05170 [Gammaproteobacteria bacterium]|nr:MAG: hypothetical protein CSA50_05170 [Gammaproteobacteria bacterium]
MSKIIVKTSPSGDHIPFFKGILTQSLVNAGIDFENAYRLAHEVKDSLKDIPEITTTALRAKVAKAIESSLGSDQRRAYQNETLLPPEILIHTDSHSSVFSVGLLARSLEACALTSAEASGAARCVYAKLKASGRKEIHHKMLRKTIYQCLQSEYSQQAANRYVGWRCFKASNRPLIILIGGVAGSGKSTIASELSYRLGIPGTQSTDLIREIIRSYLTPQVVPTLSYSSFEAWRGLKTAQNNDELKHETKVVMGYLSQMETLSPALEATLARSVTEGQDLILEGVHIIPSRLDLSVVAKDAIVIPIFMAVTKKALLRNRFNVRGSENKRRKASRYIESLDDIWELQSFILSEADEEGIAIINSASLEQAVAETIEVISNTMVKLHASESESYRKMAGIK